MAATTHETCPDRVIQATCKSFLYGSAIGSAVHSVRGAYESPVGQGLRGGLRGAFVKGPRFGAHIAAFFGLYTALNCSMEHVRQKNDFWNVAVPAAAAGIVTLAPRAPPLLLFAATVGLIQHRVTDQ